METDDRIEVPNEFLSGKLQSSYELFYKGMKILNSEMTDTFIKEQFMSTLMKCELGGYVKM